MKYLLLLLCLLSTQEIFGQQVPHTPTHPGLADSPFHYVESGEVGIPNVKLELLREEMISWVENGDPVGNELLIMKDGKIIFHESFGWSDLADKKPVKRNSIWNIRSMTKPITATAIMMLVEDDLLSLDDRVIEYIPEFKGHAETTIKHLLSHTSGYSRNDFSDYEDSHKNLEDWLMSGATKEPTGEFGKYEYTDFGFVACAYILEKVTGVSLKDYITKNIISPLRLEDTRVNFSDRPEWRSRISTWYIINQKTGNYEVNWPADREGWRIFGGAWGMFSTVLDYAEFLSVFQHHGTRNQRELITQSSVERMVSPHGFSNNIPMYGYGWMLQVTNEDQNTIINFGHRGGDALAGYVFPEQDMIVVYMSHSRGGYHRETLMETLKEMELIEYTKYQGSPIRPEDYQGAIAKLTGKEQNQFSGLFKETGENDNFCELSSEETYLTLKCYNDGRKIRPTFDLVYLNDNKFVIGDYLSGELDWLNPDALLEFYGTEGHIDEFDFKYRNRLLFKAVRKNR